MNKPLEVCRHCEAEIPAGHHFCGHCGQKAGEPLAPIPRTILGPGGVPKMPERIPVVEEPEKEPETS